MNLWLSSNGLEDYSISQVKVEEKFDSARTGKKTIFNLWHIISPKEISNYAFQEVHEI